MPFPRLGDQLRIWTHDKNDFHQSKLVEVSESNYYIEIPLHHRSHQPLIIADNEPFSVQFNARDGSLCTFASKRLHTRAILTPVWEIGRPSLSEIAREQRREYVRVAVDLPVSVTTRDGVCSSGLTRDISGGGLAAVLPIHGQVKAGDVVDLRFQIPRDHTVIEVKSLIIRIIEANKRDFVVVSTQFLGIPESIRQRIIQFVFKQQRMRS